MSRLVLLLEESSIQVLLDRLLPRLYPNLEFLCIPHEGKQELEKSIPRKLRAFRDPGDRFIIVRDNDGGDCRRLKERLVSICDQGGRPNTVVRVACQELEAWYLGEPNALAKAFGKDSLRKLGVKARFRQPDSVICPSAEVERLVPEYQKISGARRIADHLTQEGNKSPSFQVFLKAIDRLA